MNARTQILLASLAGALGLAYLYFRNRESGASADALEEVTVTAKKIGADTGTATTVAVKSAWESILDTAARVSNFISPAGEQYRPIFDAAEAKYSIPHGLLFRQAYQESRFRQDIITGKVRSSAGAVGIMQIVPKWHPEVGEAGALNVPIAVNYAAKILSQWKKQFGTWELALAAYNAGPGNVQKYGGIPPFEETQKYVSQITSDVSVRVA